ncbi:MAG TPA: MFS transporter [Bacteroidales bacterium]|mgnify:CR=1 FL=1|nr:MFS transporter [Bacteroidales bacterium]HOH22823.1 MFS transporter [Bacteroidales bacterium]HPZ03881.1 MFS transporter [Bacteroidales bacterium]HQB75446.1 MFS transporter [Bacteroidales bacterium]
MKQNKISLKIIFPVLLSFFVMSFCDLVGIGVDRVKEDFELSNTIAGLIPSAVFLWFFILSVPVGVLQDRIGKRNMLNIGMSVTALGLFFPLINYSVTMVLIGFALLGIGNTIVQVSANPLLVDVVPSNRRSSFLSFSQFIKALGSMIAPPLAGILAAQYGDWKLIFLIFGIVSLLSVIWLYSVKIEESVNLEKRATFGSSFKLLGNRYIALMVLGIFLVVGIDVGVNAISGSFLKERFGTEQILAESGRSIYFFGKMLGTFLGAMLLTRISTRHFFIGSSILGLISILVFAFIPSEMGALVLLFIIGLGFANIFPLIFSITVGRYPDRANEISGLMVMAISGGAVIPPLMGFISDRSGIVAAIGVLIISAVYLLGLSFSAKEK